VLALETFAFSAQPGHFIIGQGSPGMGTSRGKIHGIGVFGKTLLPLLFGWLSGCYNNGLIQLNFFFFT
jgi:hypothetical protein